MQYYDAHLAIIQFKANRNNKKVWQIDVSIMFRSSMILFYETKQYQVYDDEELKRRKRVTLVVVVYYIIPKLQGQGNCNLN